MDGIMDGVLYERRRADRAEEQNVALREENARLRAELDRPRHETLRQLADVIERNERLTRERDEARAETQKAGEEIERWKLRMDKECCRLEAEVARLNGLILDVTEPFPAGCSKAEDVLWCERRCEANVAVKAEASRIRAQREEGR